MAEVGIPLALGLLETKVLQFQELKPIILKYPSGFMELSVLLPTCNRPAMLGNALRSVANQTAINLIKDIVVIENGENRDSESVCKHFPMLPIRYIYRDNPIPPGYESAQDGIDRIGSAHFAILFDDDWWMDNHIERGINSFKMYPDAIASFTACGWTESEDAPVSELFAQFNTWLAASSPLICDRWEFCTTQMIVANLISTGFHFSSMIANTDAWRRSLEVVRNGNPFDTDRLIAVELSLYGSVIVDRVPTVYIRRHIGQEGVRLTNSSGPQWFDRSSKILLDRASDLNINLFNEYMSRMAQKSISVSALKRHCYYDCVDRFIESGIIPNVDYSKTLHRHSPAGHVTVIATIIRLILPKKLRAKIVHLLSLS